MPTTAPATMPPIAPLEMPELLLLLFPPDPDPPVDGEVSLEGAEQPVSELLAMPANLPGPVGFAASHKVNWLVS